MLVNLRKPPFTCPLNGLAMLRAGGRDHSGRRVRHRASTREMLGTRHLVSACVCVNSIYIHVKCITRISRFPSHSLSHSGLEGPRGPFPDTGAREIIVMNLRIGLFSCAFFTLSEHLLCPHVQ